MPEKGPIPSEHAFRLWQGQVRLYFSRFQTIAALEVAAMAGWYGLCVAQHPWVAKGLMIATAFLAMFIAWLMYYDRKDAAHFRALYFENYEDTRKPPKVGPWTVYGMAPGVWIVGALALVNWAFVYFGCACILGDSWKCVM